MELSFERNDDGRWYVILPEYDGDHEDLEMVEGADKMLDTLTTDGMYVTMEFDTEELEDDFFTLEMEAHDGYGAFYNVVGCPAFNNTVWLCNVTHVVFGDHPERIYCRVIE